MRTFEYMLRNFMAAFTFGSLAIGGSIVAATAPAATAQSSKGFVDSYMAAKALFETEQYSEALARLDAAAGYATNLKEKHAVGGMKVIVYSRLKNDAELVKVVEAELALGGLHPTQEKNYWALLEGAYFRLGQPPKAEQ